MLLCALYSVKKFKYKIALRVLSKNTIESISVLLAPPSSLGLPTVWVGKAVAVEGAVGVAAILTGGGGLGHLPGLVTLHFDHSTSVCSVSFSWPTRTIIA